MPRSPTAPRPGRESPWHIAEFAAALADHLPGRWQPDPTPTPIAEDPASDRIWDSGPLPYASFEARGVERIVLTSPHGFQLVRPHRANQYLVLPMLPAGTSHEHVQGLEDAPRGIAVTAHPARAATAVRRRFLLGYRLTAMPAWRRASPGRLRVEVRFDAEALPRLTCIYGLPLVQLLAFGGFLLDPGTGERHLPSNVSPDQAERQLHRSVGRLRSLGLVVAVRPAAGPARTDERSVKSPPMDRSPGRHR
ncbi:hypothetical protein [Streptomyces scabiei]|uniref:hypothetical protein n=1 Tax=Streptomyces scabiei TaxID=1930 RepID=UPI0029A473B9|nr:hypothetical protein [Streptomyces scabiei]MDX3523280.1 hypothetical protein [Streptomyces scabiei]